MKVGTKKRESSSLTSSDHLTGQKVVRLEENFKRICLFYKLPLSYCTSFLKYLNNARYESDED